MDPRWIAILLCLPMLAGCIDDGEPPSAKEGDLELTISTPDSTYSPGQDSIPLRIEIRNVCGHEFQIEDSFRFGSTLFPSISSANGSEVTVIYPQLDYEPRYSIFLPGETKVVVESLDASMIKINHTERDFNWDIPGSYKVSVRWSDHKTGLEVRSNETDIMIGDYLDPVEGDLQFTISMDNRSFLPHPSRMNMNFELKNICDHPVLIESHFRIGYTIFGRAIAPNGSKIFFYPWYYPDHPLIYIPLYPGRSLSKVLDVAQESHLGSLDGNRYRWNQTGIHTITMYWVGVMFSNLSFASNTITVEIVDCPHPKAGDLSLIISMSYYPVTSNDKNLTVELRNVCDGPVLVEDMFCFGCALSGVVTLSNTDVVEIHPDVEIDHSITYTPLLPGASKIERFDLSWLDYVWDDPGTYRVSVVYHDEWNNSAPIASNEITYEIIDGP